MLHKKHSDTMTNRRDGVTNRRDGVCGSNLVSTMFSFSFLFLFSLKK